MRAVETRIDVDLALGRHDDVVPELQALVAEHRLRERLRGQLILALYRSGRKADALHVYEDARLALAEELGLEPSEGLQQLHREVLKDDPALSAPARVAPRSETARVARAPLPMFSGRRGMLLGLGGALLLAAALAVAVFEVTRDRTSAGIVSVEPNSLAAIDPETNRIVAEIPVGARPASVVFASGALWVANLDDDNVMRIDPKTRRVVRTIATGIAASGLAGGAGAVWAIGGERGVVLRIDPVFNEVVNRINTVKVGTLLTAAPATGAIAATARAVWAISGGFFSTPRLSRIDPTANRVAGTVTTGNGPTAVATGFGDVWVTDSFENTVSRIDPTGVVTAHDPRRPRRERSRRRRGRGLGRRQPRRHRRQDRPSDELGDENDSGRALPERHRGWSARRLGHEQERRHRFPDRSREEHRRQDDQGRQQSGGDRRRGGFRLVHRSGGRAGVSAGSGQGRRRAVQLLTRLSKPIRRSTRTARSTTRPAPSCSTTRTRPLPPVRVSFPKSPRRSPHVRPTGRRTPSRSEKASHSRRRYTSV